MCGKSEEKQPEIQYTMSPNQQRMTELFKQYQEPYMESQWNIYKDVFEPQARSLGQKLGNQLNQPLTLPDDVWNSLWGKARDKTINEFGTVRQSATERAAGAGMLGQGPFEKYMQNLDLYQAKSIEDLAADMAIQEWTEKKLAQQQAIQNSMAFQGMSPNFNLNLPTETAIVNQPEQGNWLTGATGTGGNISDLMFGSSPQEAMNAAQMGFMLPLLLL